MAKTSELIAHWRAVGPVEWAEGAYGWVGLDGQPVKLTEWQRAALMAWWEHRETCTTFAISNVKKSGKTFTDALLLAWRWLALPGLHFAVGNDLDQAAGRQFSEISDMVRRNPFLRENVRVTAEKLTFTPTQSVLVALPVDAAGNAGANHLTASHTEAWGIVYEAGMRAYEELSPPPGRTRGYPALRIVDSYAGFEGESNVWHALVDRGLKGERVSEEWPVYQAGGLVLFHITGEEARQRCYRGDAAEAAAYYAEQRADLRLPAWTRQHENERTGSESQFVSEEQWAACYSPDVKPLTVAVLGDTRGVVFGADASTSRDLTALVGCHYNRETKTRDIVYCRVWRPVKIMGVRGGKPTVDLDGIKSEILRLRAAGVIQSVYYDPYQLHGMAVDLEKSGVNMVECPQTATRIEADQGLYDAIIGRTIRHYGDPVLNEHIRNAVAIETPRGFRLAKEKTSRKIDAAVACSMAHYGAILEGEFTPLPDQTGLERPSKWGLVGDPIFDGQSRWKKDWGYR